MPTICGKSKWMEEIQGSFLSQGRLSTHTSFLITFWIDLNYLPITKFYWTFFLSSLSLSLSVSYYVKLTHVNRLDIKHLINRNSATISHINEITFSFCWEHTCMSVSRSTVKCKLQLTLPWNGVLNPLSIWNWRKLIPKEQRKFVLTGGDQRLPQLVNVTGGTLIVTAM